MGTPGLGVAFWPLPGLGGWFRRMFGSAGLERALMLAMILSVKMVMR